MGNLSKDFLIDGSKGNDTIKVPGSGETYTVKGGFGADTILFSGDVDKVNLIQGGGDNDTLTFTKKVSASTVYGGKGADTFIFSGTVDAKTKIAGSAGADTITFDANAKVIGSSIVQGDADDDRISFAARVDTSSM